MFETLQLLRQNSNDERKLVEVTVNARGTVPGQCGFRDGEMVSDRK